MGQYCPLGWSVSLQVFAVVTWCMADKRALQTSCRSTSRALRHSILVCVHKARCSQSEIQILKWPKRLKDWQFRVVTIIIINNRRIHSFELITLAKELIIGNWYNLHVCLSLVMWSPETEDSVVCDLKQWPTLPSWPSNAIHRNAHRVILPDRIQAGNM